MATSHLKPRITIVTLGVRDVAVAFNSIATFDDLDHLQLP